MTQKKSSIVFIADPEVLAIPVKESGEKCIDLLNQNKILYGPSPEIENNTDYTRMRASVYEKLCQAQVLLPKGLRFCVYEAYRSLNLQEMLFNTRKENVEALHPDWSAEAIFHETIRLVSPVINFDGSQNIPPHGTGAAVDVYLIDEKGEAIDMGIHPKDWLQDVEGTLSQTQTTSISREAAKNRQIMSEVLTHVGLVNYPTEFWHWSYGDRYWAFVLSKPEAIFDRV